LFVAGNFTIKREVLTMPKTKIGIFFLEDEPDMFELLKDTCPEEYKVLGEPNIAYSYFLLSCLRCILP